MRIKGFIYAFGIFLIMLLQTTILNYIKFNNIKPNLILVYIVCSSILEGSRSGALIGLFAGLIQDIAAGKILGFYAIMGMYLGVVSGLVNKRLYKDNYIVAFFLTFLLTIIYEGSVYFFSGPAGSRTGILFAFKKIILPEAIYNSIFSILMFCFLVKITTNTRLESKTTKK